MTAARHGTTGGHAVHLRAGERPCDPCYRAKAEYDKRRRAAPARAREARTKAVAQRRAYQALAHRYPDEYRAEYERAKAELAAEGRRPPCACGSGSDPDPAAIANGARCTGRRPRPPLGGDHSE